MGRRNNYVTVADNAAQRARPSKTRSRRRPSSSRCDDRCRGEKLAWRAPPVSTAIWPARMTKLSGGVIRMVQDIQNRNDQQKQIQALTEQQNASSRRRSANYTAKFQVAERADRIPDAVTTIHNRQPCVHPWHVRAFSHIPRKCVNSTRCCERGLRLFIVGVIVTVKQHSSHNPS